VRTQECCAGSDSDGRGRQQPRLLQCVFGGRQLCRVHEDDTVDQRRVCCDELGPFVRRRRLVEVAPSWVGRHARLSEDSD